LKKRKDMTVGLCYLHAACAAVCLPPPIYFWNAKEIFIKLGVYIVTCIPTARQQVGKHITVQV
jgi:hypothetical protein